MTNAITELSKLNFEGKEWISFLRNKICLTGKILESDIEEAFNKINSNNKLPELTISTASEEEGKSYKTLHRLYNNVNVAGLYDNKIISFSPTLTVIYGKNGSGKSSYYKILKDAFHSSQKMLGNIYTPSRNPITAKMDFVDKIKHQHSQRKGGISDLTTDEDTITIGWTAGNQRKSKIKFCDQDILLSTLSKKDAGWSLDRYKLSYYDLLRIAIEQVETKTNNKIFDLNSFLTLNLRTIQNGLKSNTPESVQTFLSNNKENLHLLSEKLINLNGERLEENISERKSELQRATTISIEDLSVKIEATKTKVTNLEKIINFLISKKEILSSANVVKAKKERLIQLKNSLDFSKLEQYQLLFNPSQKPDQFIALIKKITETALAFEYEDYPNDIKKCFYCNQDLTNESNSLISQIHNIVNSELNKEIGNLSIEIESFLFKIDSLENNVHPIEFSEIGEIFLIDNKHLIPVDSILNNTLKKDNLVTIKEEIKNSNLKELNLTQSLFDINILIPISISEKECLLNKILKLHEQLNTIEKSKSIAKEDLKELEDREFLSQQKNNISELIGKIDEIQKHKSAANLFQGYKLKVSRDKGRVEEQLIRNDYLDKFNKNLDFFELAKRDKIKRPFSNPGGKSKIEGRIEANGGQFSVSDILSEGEAKVYSLCDWLTELEFDENSILIFDDPITSLDQVNTGKLVEKIVHLSRNYQTIVFTHNMEFYHRLVQQSLGGSPLNNSKCGICSNEIETNQCVGLVRNTGQTHKCCSYYQIEYILQPGQIKEEVIFLSLNWEQRIEILRKNLLLGDIREADKHLRTTINNFFERYVLNDIKRQVYKNNDLIKEWRDIRDIENSDYDTLMEVHNKVSAEGSIHEPSIEVRTTLDVQGYISEFNKTIKAINNIRSFRNTSPPPALAEIAI